MRRVYLSSKMVKKGVSSTNITSPGHRMVRAVIILEVSVQSTMDQTKVKYIAYLVSRKNTTPFTAVGLSKKPQYPMCQVGKQS